VKSKDGICLAIILTVFFFYLFTIRAGQPWPDDFAMYVGEAKNLAHHIPLKDTGYIYNPANAGLGPRLYPPVFPAFLVPAYDMGGLANLTPMKVEVILFFVGMLAVLWLGLGKYLTLWQRAALLAIVGFNPLLWTYKDEITSDIPFTFFFYLTLVLADTFIDASKKQAKVAWRIAVLALLIYLCYGTRTLGIVLVPALLLVSALNWKRGGRPLAAASVIGLIPCVIQMKLFGGEATYADQLRLGPVAFLETAVRNVATYGWSLATFWDNSYSRLLRDALFVSITLLAGIAYFRRLKTAPRIYEVILPLYLAIVLLFPNSGGARYLIPIFPLYIYYCLEGIGIVGAWTGLRRTEAVLAPVLAVIFLSYCAEYSRLDFGPFREGMEDQQTKALFSFVDSNTTAQDVFVFRRPRAFALFTGRNAAIYPQPKDAVNFVPYFEAIGATYLIEAPELDDPIFDQFIEMDCPAKQLVFSNSEFRVFHVNSNGLEACKNPAPSARPLLSSLLSSTAP
jgi:hypothetical protein